ncbi:ImmA/IrrE family metallo-endopeptidase [Clostridium sp. DL1XJH146]
MADFRGIAYERARNFRDKYELGNYCANQLLEILDSLEKDERINIELIRTPFKNLKLAGFIGYKYDTFVIVTNTNQTYGYERFTIAHEIYHLLENRVYIKQNSVIEEMVNNNDGDVNIHEQMADSFAAELLIPEKSLKDNVNQITENKMKDIDSAIVIQLQHKYGVDYIAMTKRLKEIGIITDIQKKMLDKIVNFDGKLQELTKKLGRSNDLNIPSKDVYILQKNLEVLKSNFEEGNTTYDDLVRIFGYLGCTPEKFGYEEDSELSEEAKEFMKSLQD